MYIDLYIKLGKKSLSFFLDLLIVQVNFLQYIIDFHVINIHLILQKINLKNKNDSYLFLIPDYVIDTFTKFENISVQQFLDRYNFNNLIANKSSHKNGFITMNSGLEAEFDLKMQVKVVIEN